MGALMKGKDMKPSEFLQRDSSSSKMQFLQVAMALTVVAAALGSGCQGTKIDSITVMSNATGDFPKGTTRQYSAVARNSDSTTTDVTSLVVWTSSNEAVATVSNNTGSRGLVTAASAGQAQLTATYENVTGTISVPVSDAALNAILVAPQNPVLANGTTVQLSATGVYSDGTNNDITQKVVWTSGTPDVATIAATGLVSGVAPGTSEMTATAGSFSGKVSLTVTNASLTQLAVTPAAPTLAKGTTVQLIATGTFSDSTTQDVTSLANWTSGTTTVATVSNQSGSRGLVTGVANGSSTVTASLSGKTGSTNVSISNASLTSITVSPASGTSTAIANGTTLALVATGNFSDGSQQNLTSSVTWNSSVGTVATVSAAGLVSGLSTGQTVISARMGSGVVGNLTVTITNAVLTAIAVTPPGTQSVAAGTSLQFVATGSYSDGTTQDLTSAVSWTSSNTGFATVSSGAGTRGLSRGVAAGTATITATLGAISGTATLNVTNATLVSISVTPATRVIANGTSLQYTATGIFSSGPPVDLTTQVAWSSSDSTLASIASSTGLATGLAVGTVTITATAPASMGSVSGSTTLGISNATLSSIQVQSATLSIANGINLQFTAIGRYSDSTTQNITSLVSWSSSDTSVATISSTTGSNGLLRSVGVGSSTITATLGGVSNTANLTVTSATLVAVSVTPATQVIAKGTNLQFTATGIFTAGAPVDITSTVTWGTSDATIADVSNATNTKGLATALGTGTVTITATAPAAMGGIMGTTTLGVSNATLSSIDVLPTNRTIARGFSQPFTAIGHYSDTSTQDITSLVTWTSSDGTVATISNTAGSTGLATTPAGGVTGTSRITAMLGAVSGFTMLTVNNATLTAISVTAPSVSLAKGTAQNYLATGLYSDGSTADLTSMVSWTSSNMSLATINSTTGLATAVAAGTVTIGASIGTVSGSTALVITNATLMSIQVNADNSTIALGTTEQFTARGLYSDGSNQDITSLVTWSTSVGTVAAISNTTGSRGLVSALTKGMTTITATDPASGKSGTLALTVSNATLVSIAVTPGGSVLARGTQLQFNATGLFSDGSTQDLTTSANWGSSATAVATVDNTAGMEGVVTAVAMGSATITATDTASGKSGSTKVTVTNALLSSIAITPATPSIAAGTTQQLTAIGTFNDGRKQDLTTLVTWSSSTANVTVSNAAGTEGLARGIAVTTATISAQLLGVTGMTTLKVTNAVLVSLAVTAPSAMLPIGFSEPFMAIGTYSDSSTQNLTTDPGLTWSSSDSTLAMVSNGTDKGVVTGVAEGAVTITATFGTITGTKTLNVTKATLMSIAVTPAASTITAGMPKQFTAIGTFDDATTLNITQTVTWSSSMPTLVSIDPITGVADVAGGVMGDSVNIMATYMAISDMTTLTVN